MPQVQIIALAVVGFIIASLVAAVLWFRSEAHDEKALRLAKEQELATAVTTNATNIATIARLKDQKQKDDNTVAALNARLGAISDRTVEQTRQIANLERKNHDVQAYLAAPVPVDLARLLNAGAARDADRVRRQSDAKGPHGAVPQARH